MNTLPEIFAVSIPNETVSRIVQSFFFEKGIYWNDGQNGMVLGSMFGGFLGMLFWPNGGYVDMSE